MKLTADQLKARARAGIGQGMTLNQFVLCHPKALRAKARKAYLEACSEGAVDNITAGLDSLSKEGQQ